MPQRHRPAQPLALIVAALALLGLGACSTLPTTAPAQQSMADANAEGLRKVQAIEPIQGPLTLEQAQARALKFNLDRRSRLLEEALAFQQYEVNRFDLLPRLVAQAGGNWRSNDRISQSRNSEDGALSPSRFVSQDRSHTLVGLDASWSLLDFGLGYYGQRQQLARVQIAAEKRRKAMHLLLQDVRTAYWRAVSAQHLRGDVQRTLELAEEALRDSRQAEQERLRNPVDALRYQRQLLENLRLLESVDQELSAARLELASLVGATPGTPVTLAEGQLQGVEKALLERPLEQLEAAALTQNPDLIEQHHNGQIAREEVRRTLLRLFPNLSFNYGLKYDSDSYLVHRNWSEAGLQLSFNLFNVLTGSSQLKLAEAGVALADQRRLATQMSVLAQVHLARLQLFNAQSQYQRADAIFEADRRIAEHTRNRENVQQSKLDRVANETSAILSLLRRYQAMAQVQAAGSRLLATVGEEPALGSVDELSVDQLAALIARQPAAPGSQP
jgi:outer membrane protein TolC